MPIDPSISLQAGAVPGGSAGVPAAGASAGNALSMMSGFADTATKLQQLRLLNQTVQARQRAAELISQAPDLESGMNAVLRDPVAAFGAGETINQFRQGQLALTQQQGEIQKQASSSLGDLLHGLNGAVQNPAQFNPIASAYLQTVSPQARPQVSGAIDSIRKYLTQSPDQQTYQKNLGALIMGAGVSPDVLRATTGALAPTPVTGPYGPGGAEAPVVLGGPATGGGLQPGVPQPPASGNVLAAPGALQPPVSGPVGPSQSTSEFNKKRAQAVTDELGSLDERVQVGGTIMQTLREGQDAMAAIRAGGGATAYAKAAQLAQALGAPQDLVDKLANGNLAASQEFGKLMVNTTMGQIQNQVPPGSKLNQQEFKVFNANNPNLDTDPRAIDKIFNFWTRIYNRDFQEQQAFASARKEPGFDILDWPARWQKQMHASGMIQPSTSLAGSQQPPKADVHWGIVNGQLVRQ